MITKVQPDTEKRIGLHVASSKGTHRFYIKSQHIQTSWTNNLYQIALYETK